MQRVVITGLGAVSPLGLNVADSWKGAREGMSGLGPLTLPILQVVRPVPVCEVKGFDPELSQSKKELGRQDRYQHFAMAAAQEAMTQSGFVLTDENRHRVGVAISASSGGYMTFESQLLAVKEKGRRGASPFAIPMIMPNGAAALVAMRYGACGPSFSVNTACASSSDGLGHAMMLLRSGICDAVIAGGAEAPLHTISFTSFDRMGLATKRDTGTPSPFCLQRDGLVLGEGAAVLVLETLEHAQKRGAVILAELAGYGASSDAYHIATPAFDGDRAARAISTALNDAGVGVKDVGYINAHGTGTKVNDMVETAAIKRALGEFAQTVPISSTKSMTGHLGGATSALELIFCALAIRDGVVPPTINYREKDPECDLDYTPNEAREVRVKVAMSNSFGFGGHNSVLVVKAFAA